MSELSLSGDHSANPGLMLVGSAPSAQQDDSARQESGYSARGMLAILFQHTPLILGCVAAVTLLSAAVALVLPRTYVAEAIIILDTRQQNIVQQPVILSNLVTGSLTDQAVVRSEVELLNSPAYARKIIERLDLLHDPVFQDENKPNYIGEKAKSLFRDVRSRFTPLIGPPEAITPDPPMGRAIVDLKRHLGVYNDNRSYAINLNYESRHPDFAARVVNTLAAIYESEQLDSRTEVSRRASAWLKSRLGGLEANANVSERKVAEFEQENHIETVLAGNVTEQRLHELTRQLLAASDDLAQKQAVLAQATSLIHSPGGALAATQVLSSPLIQKLREEEAAAAAHTAPLQKAYNEAYPTGDPRVQEIDQRIGAEVQRILVSLARDVSAARARQDTLEEAIRQEQAKLDTIYSARVQLVQLQHEANSNRALADKFLDRSQQLEVDEQALQTGARVVPAEPPVKPSFPNTLLFIGFGFFGSLFTGVLLAFVVEHMDETIRTTESAARLTGLPTLGMVPRVRTGADAIAAITGSPLSIYSDAINSILIAIRAGDRNRSSRVIAFSSAVPNEGKTLIASSLARAAATAGIRTLLIDCDMRRPGIGAIFGQKSSSALEAMFKEGSTELSRFVGTDEASGLKYLPTCRLAANPQEILGSQWLNDLIARARVDYDLVVMDTPPLLSVSDALLVSRITDSTILVVRWGQTAGALITEAIRLLQLHGKLPLGTVLSLVDMRTYLRRRRSGSYQYGYRRLTAGDAY